MNITTTIAGQTVTGPNLCDHCGTIAAGALTQEPRTDCDCICHAAARLLRPKPARIKTAPAVKPRKARKVPK